MKYEIWLGDHYTHFDRGIAHLADGRELPLKKYVHVATYGSDSVMVIDEESYSCADFPFRWFTRPGELEIYEWDDTVESVIFHNASSEAIKIDGICTLAPGESKELQHNE